jgi:phage head maturation protease
MEEDSKGLHVEGRLFALDTDRGKSVYAAMKEGELDGLSIGYNAIKVRNGEKPSEPYRTIEALDLKEVSVVLFGMNDQALIQSVKSGEIDAINSLSEAERFLREAGRFDRKTATAFVSRLKRLSQREAAGEAETVALIKRAADLIKK